ncbi:hypothetical protein ANCCAN_26314 [Ancylostoma caninum]|uniref:Uncharacterized protein n=1 Tax=Ancylostoma caninum TaxID=29170 RepID=A0A368FAD3_ANCCA|nr:hypothetical protein ANCCAN_26314 [Ancylostoma caninum]
MGVFKLLCLLLLIEATTSHFHGGYVHHGHHSHYRPQRIVQNSPPVQADYYIPEPWYPKSIPYAPGGDSSKRSVSSHHKFLN